MSDILVIGGAGFVGSNLCKRLVELGHTVISVDNYSSGTVKNHHSDVMYLRADAKKILDMFPIDEVKFDIVFHLGEYSRVEQSFADIQKTFESNNQLISVLEFCRLSGSRLIYSGSSTKFATDTVGKNLSPYTWTKATNTELIKTYKDWYPDFDYRIAYFYNVYGENEIADGQFATVVAKYKKLYKEGKPLPITKPGTQLRNFTHISDIVDGLICIMKNDIMQNQCLSHEYGIGSPLCYSIEELAAMFNTKIEYQDPKPGNRLAASLEFSDKLYNLGWSPKHDLKDHIREFIEQN